MELPPVILRRYGTWLRSVVPAFDSRALTEIGFRRDHRFEIPVADFEEGYEPVEVRELTAEAEGSVHDEAESELLRILEEQVTALLAELGEGEVLLVESTDGRDHPKTRDRKVKVVVEGENRLYFHWWVDPPLRLGIYRKRPEESGGAAAS